jgi:hypothetical protein
MNEQSSLPNAISNVISDLADLLQKEVRLARAELSEKLSITFRAGIWISAAAILSIVALLLACSSLCFGTFRRNGNCAALVKLDRRCDIRSRRGRCVCQRSG